MDEFNVYFFNTPEPMLVMATSFAEAEQTVMRKEKFKTICKIEKVRK